MPLQSELNGVLDSDPGTAPCDDCFMLEFIKYSGQLAIDLTSSSVRGRLRKFVDFWRTLEASQFILDNIMQGYKIPFFSTSNAFCEEKQHLYTSARENSDFASRAFSRLLRLDLI